MLTTCRPKSPDPGRTPQPTDPGRPVCTNISAPSLPKPRLFVELGKTIRQPRWQLPYPGIAT